MADYFVEGGDVLENKLGITDPEQLREAEEDAFSDTAADILNEDLSGAILDFNFFKQLHGRLFGKVYPFAGQIRTVNITKQDSSIPFCYADFIEPEANRIFKDLGSKDLQVTSSTTMKWAVKKLSRQISKPSSATTSSSKKCIIKSSKKLTKD